MTTDWGFPDFDDHEGVHLFTDPVSGLRAVIAIHSTKLGPAAGGVRFWHYADSDRAITDALRLSRGMSFKNAMAGLDLGGGKGVVLAANPGDTITIETQCDGLPLDHRQSGGGGEHRLDCAGIETPVGLDTRPLDRGALAAIEHPVMDRGGIRRTADQPVKGIDLADHMALSQATDRRITRHRTDMTRIE